MLIFSGFSYVLGFLNYLQDWYIKNITSLGQIQGTFGYKEVKQQLHLFKFSVIHHFPGFISLLHRIN